MNCILCNGLEYRRVYSDDRITLIRCTTCGIVCQKNYQESISKISNAFSSIECYYKKRKQNKIAFNHNKVALTQDIQREIFKYIRPYGRVLDIGSGRGEFLAKIKEAGFNVTGLEPNLALAKFVEKEEGFPVIAQMYQASSFSPDTFDAITFIQVLEHLSSPLEQLSAAHKHLKAGGLIVIDVPSFNNPRILAYRIFRWRRLVRRDFIPSHCYYYTRHTLANLVEKAGFRIWKVETGRYSIKSGLNNFVMRIIDRFANQMGIGGITLYATKP